MRCEYVRIMQSAYVVCVWRVGMYVCMGVCVCVCGVCVCVHGCGMGVAWVCVYVCACGLYTSVCICMCMYGIVEAHRPAFTFQLQLCFPPQLADMFQYHYPELINHVLIVKGWWVGGMCAPHIL